MSSGFELPFQWDDGNHFAPVVFTKEEELQTITDILFDNNTNNTAAVSNTEDDEQQQLKETTTTSSSSKVKEMMKKKLTKLPSGPMQDEELFIDAGCGNGRVPLYVAAALQSLKKTKNNKVLGIDIEEDLIEKANSEAKSLGFSKEQVSFVAGDLKQSLDLLKSCHFVYCYLLPGDLLTELMTNLTESWSMQKKKTENKEEQQEQQAVNCRVIISHTWEISCLEKYFVGRAGEFWVYDRDAVAGKEE